MELSINALLNLRTNEHLKVISITTLATLGVVQIWRIFKNQEQSLYKRCQDLFFKILFRVPRIKKKKEFKLNEIRNAFQKDVIELRKNVPYITELPISEKSSEDILNLLKDNLQLGNYDWLHGKVSGSVYRFEKNLINLLKDVFALTSYTNPLHPDVFPGVCKMEAEVIRIVAKLFNGNQLTCGAVTSGGTESILMACKAYRDYARTVYGIKKPEIVIPQTAHAAFDKAAQYFGLRVRHIPIDKNSTKVSIQLMEKCINSNTIMLVGSAPNFPYGTFDNIEEIAKLGVKHNIPVHVDACLGGFLIVFMNDAGFHLAPFDFRLHGVTSISADTHKYAYGPKGSSVILYSNEKYFIYQFSIAPNWPGGCYASPCISGSRSGSMIATCWATLLHFGKQEYIAATKRILETTRYIESKLRQLDGIYIFGKPEISVIAIGSKKFDIFLLMSLLNKRGWNLNNLQYPSGFHLCVTYMHTQNGVAKQFVNDLTEELQFILKQSPLERKNAIDEKMALYGMAQTITDRSIVNEILSAYLTSLYYINEN